MEIFCRNIPPQIQEKHLKKEFKPILRRFGIHELHCQKAGPRNARITVLDPEQAQRVLDRHGQDDQRRRRPLEQLRMFGCNIYLTKSRNEPDIFLLRSLQDESENLRRPEKRYMEESSSEHRQMSFYIVGMSCGLFEYLPNGKPVFVDCFPLTLLGMMTFGKTTLRVHLRDEPRQADYYIEFDYSNIMDDTVYTSTRETPSVTVYGACAPRLYLSTAEDKLAQKMRAIFGAKGRPASSKRRVGSLGGAHDQVVGTCLAYRFVLREPNDILAIQELGRQGPVRHMPVTNRWMGTRAPLSRPYPELLNNYLELIANADIPYRVKFQLQSLVWNGDQRPSNAIPFYHAVRRLLQRDGADTVALGIQKMAYKVQYASPNVHHEETDIRAVVGLLEECIADASRDLRYDIDLRTGHSNNISIHQAKVTPCGTYLYGPTTETKNRVLRHYSKYIEYFLRVQFVDEDGDRVPYDPNASLDDIFHKRFKNVLMSGITIGGRTFNFLGFSHSSLRSQTCWFVAPFHTSLGEHVNARTIISRLGSFDSIRLPAKLAARIGQAFSDTLTSIPISRDCIVMNAPDVSRNGRVFSDGVGTISPTLMYKVWKEYALREKVKPTIFQIRIAGAKGMISLHTTEKADRLTLRKSMVKFPSEDAWNIEICGAGVKALPFCLNNQLTKILEDLGVPREAFLTLQQNEILRLRSAAKSTTNVANFLETSHISKSVQLPWLFPVLQGLGLNYSQDGFLQRVVQLTLLMKLRELKYRARIPVPKAVTLYGIMDETGYLQEGQIFCSFLSDQAFREVLVKKRVAITRSPALHPGDIQIVEAVDVPRHSPLRKLHNCVAFSQYGARDLPSMLSGGDLDGDLYNVIYDDRLIPPKTYMPANYPRVSGKELDRPVVTEDIVDFFLIFMQQDQLGRIATAHQVLADQKPTGTFDSDCLLLAELHSTAVDFSKTGIPVDLGRIPRTPRWRPDFLAPGPRVRVEEGLKMLQDSENMMFEDDDDDEKPQLRYYKSNNVLGHLYRNIDEREFLEEIQNTRRNTAGSKAVLQGVWQYIENETKGFQWQHLVDAVSDIQGIYEDNMRGLMHKYSKTPWKHPISEFEVFIGAILGQNHKQSRLDREASREMRDEYNRLVDYTVSSIRDMEAGGIDALERSTACFWRSLTSGEHAIMRRDRSTSATRNYQPRHKHREEKLLSFPWIAAITCLKEVDRFQRSMPF